MIFDIWANIAYSSDNVHDLLLADKSTVDRIVKVNVSLILQLIFLKYFSYSQLRYPNATSAYDVLS